jgi:hypothetical protein
VSFKEERYLVQDFVRCHICVIIITGVDKFRKNFYFKNKIRIVNTYSFVEALSTNSVIYSQGRVLVCHLL